MRLRLALYQPDMAPNVGAAIRLAAALDVPLDIIEPCGFVWDDRRLDRTAMDYHAMASITRHHDFDAFCAGIAGHRLVLLTTQAKQTYTTHIFAQDSVLIVGRESAGVPGHIHDRADARLCIPMTAPARSLNVITAAAIVLGEALRQTRWGESAALDPGQGIAMA